MRSGVRELRRNQTPAEQALWEMLRDRRFKGLKFRRQFPISIFVADFCCFDLKLIVEVDGGIHETKDQAAHDENRDFFLRSVGYTILRIPNEQVFANPDLVLHKIATEADRISSRQHPLTVTLKPD